MRSFFSCRAIKSSLITACSSLALAFASTAMHATPITYDLVLTPDSYSDFGGTGSFTIESSPAATGISFYTVATGNLDALFFTIDGQTFSLAGSTGNALVWFLDGKLADITFLDLIGDPSHRFSLATTTSYAFSYDNLQKTSYGTFTASAAPGTSSAAPSAVPEPGSLVLLGTGLLGGAAAMFRSRRPSTKPAIS
jgi:PEP-CTERM motif